MLTENKFSKYLLYAIGEIILVVIGILIALQLNTNRENKNKKDLGYKYLTEMRSEIQNDLFFMIDGRIKMLNENIKNQVAASSTKNLAELPLDSINMIIKPINLGFNISELTFNKMKNLGLTSLTKNDSLNSQINEYYNSNVEFVKLAMDFVLEMYKNYVHYLEYEQDAFEFGYDEIIEFEFPAFYNESKEEIKNANRINSIKFITSKRGRMIISKDLSGKKYSLSVLNNFKTETQNLLKSIHDELKIYNPQIELLPTFTSLTN